MSDYKIRKATFPDIPFLTEAVIAAEKSNSDKLSYATLFNFSEDKARELIVSMFEEEIEGCELSFDSFLIAEYEGVPIATFGAWIEGFDGNPPSQLLKSNLIGFTFGTEAVAFLKAKSHVVKDLVTAREPLALQFEYLYVDPAHRGKSLSNLIIGKHEENARAEYPELKKAQVQLYGNNANAIKVYENNGFTRAASYHSEAPEVLNYLPFDEKIVMEKTYKIETHE